MAIVSIMHRISGVVLFLLLPFALYCLQASLFSIQSFGLFQQHLQSPFIKILVWGFLSALFFHFVAGVRHLLMDCGVAEGLASARMTALIVIGLEVVVIVMLGVWIW